MNLQKARISIIVSRGAKAAIRNAHYFLHDHYNEKTYSRITVKIITATTNLILEEIS